jgi:uncharacterized lipoprotein YmbA
MTGLRPEWALAGTALLLGACGTFPLPNVYLLGEPGAPAPGIVDATGLPEVTLMTVTVPDYLDSTDIDRRTASNAMITSETGRWGERLSVGITDALAADLAKRLPDIVIGNRGAYRSERRLAVAVERFEIEENGRCSLTARWRMTSPVGKMLPNSEQGTFTVAASSGSDAAAALAMTAAIDQLAGQIALTIKAALLMPPR